MKQTLRSLTFCISIFCIFGLPTLVSAQGLGYGLTGKLGLYSRYANPEDGIASRSAGNVLNIGLGPKLWVGGEKMSVSIEGAATWSPFAFSLSDYKGMGALAFPVLAKINFGGLSTHNREGKFGFSIGGGLQWSRTELYGLRNSFEDQGVVRDYFKTFIGEIAYGFGLSGFAGSLYVRYGGNSDIEANTFNLGIGVDFNAPKLKEFTDPEF